MQLGQELTRPRVIAVFAVIFSLLVTTAPVAANHGLTTVSRHSTDTDFEAGSTQNMSVLGTGESASVVFNGASVEETFVFTGAEQTWTVPGGVTEIDVHLYGAEGGDGQASGGLGGEVNGTLQVSPGDELSIYVGGQGTDGQSGSGGFNGGGNGRNVNGFLSGGGGGASDIRINGNTEADRVVVAGGGGGGAAGFSENCCGNDAPIGSGGGGGTTTGQTGGGGSLAGEGGTQTSGGAAGFSGDTAAQPGSFGNGGRGGEDNTFCSSQSDDSGGGGGGGGGGWYGGGGGGGTSGDVCTDGGGGGGGGGSNLVANLTNVNTNNRGTRSGNGLVTISYQLEAPAIYTSQNHSAQNSEQGFVNISQSINTSVCLKWETTDGGPWHTLDETCGITTTGNKTASWPTEPNGTVRLTATVSSTGSDPLFEITDEGVQANTHQPIINNSSASPTGSLGSAEQTVNISINDTDFGLSQDDNVTVTFRTNHSGVIGTDMLGENGTASTDHTFSVSGATRWWATAEDKYGHTVRSQNFTALAPGFLEIRNETNHTQIINNTTVTVEFYFDRDDEEDLIIIRETENGTIDMAGLPADEPFVVVASANEFFSRRIFVPSLFDTQDIYLLHENESAVQPTFELVDFTGSFPQDVSVLEVQRSINGTWQTVEGDFFGASGTFSAQLLFNQRHRLILTNIASERVRELGVFTPVSSSFVQLEIHPGDTIVGVPAQPLVLVGPSINSLPAASSSTITVNLDPRDTTFTDYNVKAVLDNGTKTILFNESGSQESGEDFSETVDLANQSGATVTVFVNWTTSSGAFDNRVETYIVRESFSNDYSLLAVVTRLPQRVPAATRDMFTAFLALMSIGVATAYSSTRMSTEVSGLVGLGFLGGFMMINWVPFGWFFAGSVAWVTLAAFRRGL